MMRSLRSNPRFACLALLMLTCGLAACPAAWCAGFSANASTAGEPSHFTPDQIIRFAKQVERTLAQHGAYVAIVSRMGRPPAELPPGMHYTHAGFAVYSMITKSDGTQVPGYAMYNLYQEDQHPDRSDLVQDYPIDFFAGSAVLEAGIIIPSPELQRRLLAEIASPAYQSLHDPHYSAIANPYTLGRQNCTEFVLDVINAAIYQTDDIRRIKANERAYFIAQTVNVSPLKLMFGSMFSSEVSLSDQNGTPVTATFERIADYLQKYDAGSVLLTVVPE